MSAASLVLFLFLFLVLFPSLHRRYWRRHRYSIGYVSLVSHPDLALFIVLNDFGCIAQQVFSSLFLLRRLHSSGRAQGLYSRVWLGLASDVSLSRLGDLEECVTCIGDLF